MSGVKATLVLALTCALAACGGAAGRNAPPMGPVCFGGSNDKAACVTCTNAPANSACTDVSSCSGGGYCADPEPVLDASDVKAIVERATGAVDRELIVAVTDRRGVILGVAATFPFDYRTQCGTAVCPATTNDADPDCAPFDLAVQLARTAAFFSADQTPLTSRSVRFLSGEHFPPGIRNAAAAALFGIENTNRGCSFDTVTNPIEANVPRARSLTATLRDRDTTVGPPLRCESESSGESDPQARCGCTRGIATLPGGVPIYKSGRMVGGVGVGIRGAPILPDPVAAFDAPDVVLRRDDRQPDFDVAEFAARAFAGDHTGLPNIKARGLQDLCTSDAVDRPRCCTPDDPAQDPCTFGILATSEPPFDPVIFVDGIEIPEVALDPPVDRVGTGAGIAQWIIEPQDIAQPVASQWLVSPTDSTPGAAPLSADEVQRIIEAGIAAALRTRAAIRLPLEARTAMVLAVSDTKGTLLGLFRMADATVFSIDVAVAKSRNVIYFSSPDIAAIDTLDCPGADDCRSADANACPPVGDLAPAFCPGTAITNRTLSFAAQPFFPSGIEGSLAGFPHPFAPGPFRRVFIEDSATPCTNGREPANGRQNGIVFFPGSAPLYRAGVLVGGLGISGDGVEQDDIVTAAGAGAGFEPPDAIRADRVAVRGVRLPYLKFNRQPEQ